MNGDITLLDYKIQGVFINVCAYYWHKDCDVSLGNAFRKFGSDVIDQLIDEGMIIQIGESISIKFLDEQYFEFSDRKKKLSEAGKKGAERKALIKNETTLKPPLSNPLTIREEKEKDKEDIRKVLLCNLSIDNELMNDPFNKKALLWYKLFHSNTIESGITNTATLDKARLSAWSSDVRKMIEIDKRTNDEMNVVYKFLTMNSFWKKNVRSISKLREKFEQLYLEANGTKNGSKSNTSTSNARSTQAGRQNFE